MPDDFGTVSVKGTRLGREIEVMRQRYQQHRSTLDRLASDAPTEQLASEYRRLQRQIDESLRKLNELERAAASSSGPATAAAATAAAGSAAASVPASPGARVISNPAFDDATLRDMPPAPPARDSLGAPAIAAIAVVVLAALGFLVWRSSRQPGGTATVAKQTTAADSTATAVEPRIETAAPATAAAEPRSSIAVKPASADYGAIRKGTRAVRQFEIKNGSSSPIPVMVNRADCRCLYYDYVETIPANGKETLTVTVDGARARPGMLEETVQVVAKKDRRPLATFEVRARIR